MGRFLKSLFKFDRYKSSQGRVARRLTFIGCVVAFLVAAYCLARTAAFQMGPTTICAILLAIIGFWFSFRVVNYPTFADFLVSVEAEMAKVSWPSKRELYANTKVVLIFMALFSVLIFIYDVIFRILFSFTRFGA